MKIRLRYIILLITISITISLAFLNGPLISGYLNNKGVKGFDALGLAFVYFAAVIPIEIIALLVLLFILMKISKRKKKNELHEGFKYSLIYVTILTSCLILIWSLNS